MNSRQSILLIDNDVAGNYLNTKIIQRVSKEVNVFSVISGREALEFIYTKPANYMHSVPLIIFLDLNMPVMNGFEFLKAMEHIEQNNYSILPVVVLTSSITEADIEKAAQFHLLDFVNKPLSSQKVLDILNYTNFKYGLEQGTIPTARIY